VAIATSWSLPTTECSLDRCFLDFRGPVRFQLDLETEADQALLAAAHKQQEKEDAAETLQAVNPKPAEKAAKASSAAAKASPAAAKKQEV
jgi:hypothetical protein